MVSVIFIPCRTPRACRGTPASRSPSKVSAASREAGMVWYFKVTTVVEGVNTSRRAPPSSDDMDCAVFIVEMIGERLKVESLSCL
jgi:hypothetical protein